MRNILQAFHCIPVWLVAGWFVLAPAAAQGRPAEMPRNGIGYGIDFPGPHPSPIVSAHLTESHPLHLRITLEYPSLPAGDPAWDDLDRIVRSHKRAGYRILLSLRVPEQDLIESAVTAAAVAEELVAPPEPDWQVWVRQVARRYRRRVDLFTLFDRPFQAGADPWRDRAAEFAFVLKTAAVTIRSEVAGARIGIGGAGPDPLATLESFYRQPIGPYVDAWLLEAATGGDPTERIEAAEELQLRLDPAVHLWLVGERTAAVDADGDLVRTFLEGAGRGAGMVLFRLPANPDGLPESADTLIRMHDLLPPDFVRMEDRPDTVLFRPIDTPPPPVRWYRFFDSERFRVRMGYFPAPGAAPGEITVDAVLDSWDVADLVLHDPLGGDRTVPGLYLPDRASNTTAVHLPLGPGPRLLEYRRFAAPEMQRREEELQVGGTRVPPVEEIIARHQEVQAAQDARVQRYIADGDLTFHYQLGSTEAFVDLTYRSSLFYDRAAGSEWVHRELLWNGVVFRGRKIPKLPLIEPERVVTLPLDIHMTRDYDYKLVGTDRIDGRDAYVVSFTPLREDKSLYRGRVWIDRTSFVRLQISSVQTGLESPILASEEKNRFRPLTDAGGDLWMMDAVDGQTILTVAGRNLVVWREFRFSNFRINPDDYDAQREAAYDSDAQILRETPDGFRFVEKKKDGSRELQENTGDRTLFLVGGLFYNEAVDSVLPLAGINYFDFHLGGSDAQFELFTAGVFNFINLTDPTLFGGRLEGGVDLTATAVSFTDRFFVGDVETDAAHIDEITQEVSLNLGLPFADFYKITGFLVSEYANYSRADDTDPTFVTPEDTWIHGLELRGEYHRDRWSMRLFGRAARRADWDPWGSTNPLDFGTRLTDFNTGQQDFYTWGGSVAKQWFLPWFQKLRIEANWKQGEDLDRFSKFRFSSFGDARLRGFGGSGIRFDQGGIGRLQYSFNLAEVIRFDAIVDHARVRDRTLGPGAEFQNHTGIGLAGNFVMPRGFIIRFDYGIAVASDIDGIEGEQEAQIFFLRLF